MPRSPGIPLPAPHPAPWRYSHRGELSLVRPRFMAILNLTPDSFSDGGRLESPEAALNFAQLAITHGADILDIGGESTRPGAQPIPEDLQISRTIPIIRALRLAGMTAPITIDTTRAAVAKAALDAGADAINDISAGLDDPHMLPLAASRQAGIILMHRLAAPASDQYSDRYTSPPTYTDVVREVTAFLQSRLTAAILAGIPPNSICLDPGLGFGKSIDDNLTLIRQTPQLAALGHPILSALSRKSFTGRISLNRDSTPSERLPGTLALSIAHRLHGAHIFRVHDVAEHTQALAAIDRLHSPP